MNLISFSIRSMAVTELCCRKRPTNISGKATCIMKQFIIMRAIMIISIEAELGRVFMLTVKESMLFKLKCTIRLRSRSVHEHIELYQIDIRLLWVRLEVIYLNFHIQFIRETFHYWESELIFGNLTNKYIAFIHVFLLPKFCQLLFVSN